jgi:hypothetical protein
VVDEMGTESEIDPEYILEDKTHRSENGALKCADVTDELQNIVVRALKGLETVCNVDLEPQLPNISLVFFAADPR